MDKVATRLRMRVSQTGPDGQLHTTPAFPVQAEATIGDFMDIEKKLNKIAADGTTFSLTSFWAEEEKVDD